jgi:ribosomal protein S25
VACSGQTWPYIERRCLVEAPPRLAERRASIQVGTIDARKVTAAAPDVGAAVAIDGSSAASDITASVPVAREAARSVSLENGEMQPAPIVVKKEKRSRRTPRQEQRPVSDEELAAAIEQDIAQPRAVASKRGRVVRSDRLEAAVRQLERMF